MHPAGPADALPGFADVQAAAARIAPHALRTPVRRSPALDALAGATLAFKCENLQHGGAFKFRGACNAVWSLEEAEAARGVATHSSGNHGAALALAARSRGIPAHVVVPEGAVRAKVAAIEAAGATLHRCAPTQAAREAAAARVCRETGARMVHPYTDPLVIAGQGTAALELLQEAGPLDLLVVPVGGGGLTAGSAIAAHALAPPLVVVGAEPAGAADACESLRRGERVTGFVPDTVCDGLRALIGEVNLRLLRLHAVQVDTVDDADTLAAMQLVRRHLGLVVEPSSAIVLALVLARPGRFAGRRVGLVLSGGNVDAEQPAA
jgi:threonine dehydratase